MGSTGKEVEKLPKLVLNYYFLDSNDDPISFSGLPLLWSEDYRVYPSGGSGGLKGGVFLHGIVDEGFQPIRREVRAWKLDLNSERPGIFVVSIDRSWFKLRNPRRSYAETIRSALITVNCLHYLKRNPYFSMKSLWDSMAKDFRMYFGSPAAKDLENHISLIEEAIKRDDSLAKCKFLTTFLKKKPLTRKESTEGDQSTVKPDFIVEDDVVELLEYDHDADEDEDEEGFDSVCAICDNGGDLLCCEGGCMRSFHGTVESGEDSICESLGLTNAEVEAIQHFLCTNCEHKQHQCFVCGRLGSSDKSRSTEVFACVSATCGRFYHPHCVAKLLHPKEEGASKELQKNIAGGKSFTCPVHKCCVCGEEEEKKMSELQFAVCRRCPTTYHRKCLPKEIALEGSVVENVTRRAWEDLLPNRILIYCLKHAIHKDLGTPVRDHLKFPIVFEKKTANSGKRKKPTPKLPSNTDGKMREWKSPASGCPTITSERTFYQDGLPTLANTSVNSKVKVSSEQETSKKAKVGNVPVESQKGSRKSGRRSSAPRKTDTTSPFNLHSTRSWDMSLDSNVGNSKHRSINKNHQTTVEKDQPPVENDCEEDFTFTLGLDNLIQDIGKSCGLTNEEYPANESLPNSLSPHPDYRDRNFEDTDTEHPSEQPDGFGSPSAKENERYWGDLNITPHVHINGQQDPDQSQITSCQPVSDLPFPQSRPDPSTYGLSNLPLTKPSHQVNTSAMQTMGGGAEPEPVGINKPGDDGFPPGFEPGSYDPYPI